MNWDRIFRNLYKKYPLRTSFKRLHTGFLIVIDPFNINEINILKSETFHISRFSLNMTIQNKFVIMFTLKLYPYTLELTDMLSRVIFNYMTFYLNFQNSINSTVSLTELICYLKTWSKFSSF